MSQGRESDIAQEISASIGLGRPTCRSMPTTASPHRGDGVRPQGDTDEAFDEAVTQATAAGRGSPRPGRRPHRAGGPGTGSRCRAVHRQLGRQDVLGQGPSPPQRRRLRADLLEQLHQAQLCEVLVQPLRRARLPHHAGDLRRGRRLLHRSTEGAPGQLSLLRRPHLHLVRRERQCISLSGSLVRGGVTYRLETGPIRCG